MTITTPYATPGPDRDAYIIAMRSAGHTLDAIADTLGISRERVRQLAERAGAPVPGQGQNNASIIDPLTIMRYIRDPGTRTMKQVARHIGCSDQAVTRVLAELGLGETVRRLFRWRRGAPRRRRIVGQLQAFAAKHGRAPTLVECNSMAEPGLPWGGEIVAVFGSTTAGYRAAGFEPRPVGGPGHVHGRRLPTHCKRGHPLSPENVYLYETRGGTLARICRVCTKIRKGPLTSARG